MSNEILATLEYMEKEKGIPKIEMIEAINTAISTAAQKGPYAGKNLKIEINPKTGALKSWALYTVVDSVGDIHTEIHIAKANDFIKDPILGSIIEKEIDLPLLGRIAAQAAGQAINQKIRLFEKDRLYDHYKSQVGQIVSGIIRRRERENIIIDLGKAEAKLTEIGAIPKEDYIINDSIRCLLESIQNNMRGPELILSRSCVTFVQKLFELEVTELMDKTVEIKNIMRIAGYRTKILVHSNNPKVDPVGACVGSGGTRVRNIVKELSGEKIDVIRFHEDPKRLLEEVLKPCIPQNVMINQDRRRISFQLPEEDLFLMIGRNGQPTRNAKLSSKLIGYFFDVQPLRRNHAPEQSHAGFEQRMQKAVQGMQQMGGISSAVAERLIAMGITSIEAFEGVTKTDLMDAGFNTDEIKEIIGKVPNFGQDVSSK